MRRSDLPFPGDKHWQDFLDGKACGFCYSSEEGTHREVKREWSKEWRMFIPVCRKHSFGEEDAP